MDVASVCAAFGLSAPLSTATTAGTGNPVLSVLEDEGSAFLVLVAFVLPVLAFLLVVGLLVAIFLAWRRLRRGGAARQAPT
jgi:hypothetical protein